MEQMLYDARGLTVNRIAADAALSWLRRRPIRSHPQRIRPARRSSSVCVEYPPCPVRALLVAGAISSRGLMWRQTKMSVTGQQRIQMQQHARADGLAEAPAAAAHARTTNDRERG